MRLLALLLIPLLLAGCGADPEGEPTPAGTTPTPGSGPAPTLATPSTPAQTTPVLPSAAPRFGVAYSAAPGQSPADFFVEAADLGGLVLWGGHWSELASGQGSPDVLATLAERAGVPFAAQVGFHRAGEAFDAPTQTRALEAVSGYAERHKPVFFALGVELDRIDATDPAWIDAFVPWYALAYDAVKEASPETLVFPTFQLEHTRGLTGGLFGGAEEGPERWALIDRFPDRDATAFTTYPGLVHRDPADVPETYYSAVAARFDGPLVFTETGWHTSEAIAGWESSDEEQMRFIQRFLEEVDALDARLAVWLALHDQAAARPPFDTVGLIGADGNARTAWDLWRDASTDV